MAPGEYRLNARFFGYLLLVNFKFHVCAVKTANEGILILAKMARLQLPAPSLFLPCLKAESNNDKKQPAATTSCNDYCCNVFATAFTH